MLTRHDKIRERRDNNNKVILGYFIEKALRKMNVFKIKLGRRVTKKQTVENLQHL